MELLILQRGTWFMLAGLVVQFGTIAVHESLPSIAARILGFAAGALLVYGGAQIARFKGYTPWVGFIAIFSVVGVGYLLLLPDPTLHRVMRWLAIDPTRNPDGDPFGIPPSTPRAERPALAATISPGADDDASS